MDVDEDQIAPFMEDINRHFEFYDKEDILKKIVSLEFGKFLNYYANAPEIVKPSTSRDRSDRKSGSAKREKRAPESGYRRLFINLGKDDGFYPGEVMQFINRNVHGRQDVGHIDLLARISYIEVPEEDADKVMRALNGASYRNRTVRCNDADDTNAAAGEGKRGGSRRSDRNSAKRSDDYKRSTRRNDNSDFAPYEKRSKRRNEDEGRNRSQRGKRGGL